MKSQEIRERLEKAEANVVKREATIERHKARAAKLLSKLEANGWEPNRDLYRGGVNTEAYWMVCDYEDALDTLRGAEDKLEDAKRTAQNWRDKLEAQIANERKIAKEIPEVFKAARDELVAQWVAGDIKAREAMLKARKELPYKEFRKIWKYSEEESLRHTDEEFQRVEEQEADMWLLNLWNRVKEITGEVTDVSGIHWGGKCLDGIIRGKDGMAVVETIGAGGYNIQRYHLRVLVKAYK